MAPLRATFFSTSDHTDREDVALLSYFELVFALATKNAIKSGIILSD